MRLARTVLVVDGDAAFLESLRRELGNDGYALATTTSPLEAVALIDEGGIDVLVADVEMPEMTGLELLQRVRRDHPEVVRVLSSRDASLQTALEAVRRGDAHRQLTQPWQNRDLRALLIETMARIEELRGSAEADRRERVEQLMRAELEALHPGVLEVVAQDGVHVLDATRLRALLLQVGAGGLEAVLGTGAGGAPLEITRREPIA